MIEFSIDSMRWISSLKNSWIDLIQVQSQKIQSLFSPLTMRRMLMMNIKKHSQMKTVIM